MSAAQPQSPALPRWRRWLSSPYLAPAGSALFWAGNFIVGRALRHEVAPIALSFWRWTVALAVLLPLTAAELWAQRDLLRQRWRSLAILGFTGVTAFQTCVYLALQTTTALNALLFLSLTPAAIAAGSWLFLGERLTARQAAGIGVSLVGAVVLIVRGDLGTLLGLRFARGDLWMLAAVLLWAIYSIVVRRRPTALSQLGFLSATVVAGMLFLAPMYAVAALTGHGGFHVTPATVAGVIYVALLPSVAAFVLWNRGVQRLGPNRTGMYLHLMPVFGAVLGVLFLGEAIALYQVVGAGLVFLGIAAMNVGR
ncbi:MAG: DMT family transporter [Anaerolineae bacterium]|nr:DMT family transporter [Anaerolineae bacterium]